MFDAIIGATVAASLGERLGWSVGNELGTVLGVFVVVRLGASDGASDGGGARVGDTVGATIGSDEGDTLGRKDGIDLRMLVVGPIIGGSVAGPREEGVGRLVAKAVEGLNVVGDGEGPLVGLAVGVVLLR